MERHQGSWKVEGEEEYNIGELVIDNDYIEFFVRGKSIPWACTFIGSNGEHPIKVYAKGPGETKHRSLNMSIGYRVVKVAMTNAGFQEGFEINNISAFSFEIPELVDWLKINSVSIGFTEANELFAIEEKIEPIIIKNENPHIEISFGPASPFMPPEINDRVEYVVKNYPRVHVSYEEMVTDERVSLFFEDGIKFVKGKENLYELKVTTKFDLLICTVVSDDAKSLLRQIKSNLPKNIKIKESAAK